MKFQEGDKIVVLATGEKGEVVEWINKKMLTIRINEIEFPVYADQIDFPYFDDFSKPKEIKPKKSSGAIELPKREKKLEKIIERDGVWLSFFPVLDKDIFDDDVISHLKIYLLNHTEDQLDCKLSVFFGQNKEIELKSSIHSLDELYLIDLEFDKLSDHPKFCFEFFKLTNHQQKSNSCTIEYKPKAKQMFKLSNEVIQEQKASFKRQLFSEFPLTGHSTNSGKDSVGDEPNEEGIDLKKLLAAGFKIKKR